MSEFISTPYIDSALVGPEGCDMYDLARLAGFGDDFDSPRRAWLEIAQPQGWVFVGYCPTNGTELYRPPANSGGKEKKHDRI